MKYLYQISILIFVLYIKSMKIKSDKSNFFIIKIKNLKIFYD